MQIITVIIVVTSSTAQGVGGSFKNRKPIGEIGCCESGMADESTDGPKGAVLEVLFFFLVL